MDAVDLDLNLLEHWNSSHAVLLRKLEREDARRISNTSNSEATRHFLSSKTGLVGADVQSLKNSTAVIVTSIGHFEALTEFIESSFKGHLHTGYLWGMVHLTIELSSESAHAMMNVASMIKKFGQKLELFNEYCQTDTAPKRTREAACDIYIELAEYFVVAIRYFRDQYHVLLVPGSSSGDSEWKPLLLEYSERLRNIDEIFSRIERLGQLAKRYSFGEQFKSQQDLMSLSHSNYKEEAHLPCIMVPAVKGSKSYNRTSIYDRIDAFLFDPRRGRTFRALVLYGVGGVGKSHIAFQYCQRKATSRSVDAVLWMFSETNTSLLQSFTDAAIYLKLPDVDRSRRQENRILVLNWLQNTACSWIVVFDNAESADLLMQYWPTACDHGSVLITTRNHSLQFDPADGGIEVKTFDRENGSKLLLHLLRMDVIQDLSRSEEESALQLSERLSGHALAIHHLAGLVQKRSWTIQEVLQFYETRNEVFHGRHRPNELSTIWQLSFDNLGPTSASLLGILAYLCPDGIAEELLTFVDLASLPPRFRECLDEMQFFDALEPLLTQALVKREKESKTLEIHRLVQTQYRYYMAPEDRQKAFEAAAQLLFDAFPRVETQLYDFWPRCQISLQHILTLTENYKASQAELRPTLKFSWLLSDCARYLLEASDYVELENVISVAESSFGRLPQGEKNANTLIHILNTKSLLWSHRGLFARGEGIMREAYRICNDQQPKPWLSLGWQMADLGINLASSGQYADAIQWIQRAEQARANLGDDENIKTSDCILTKNTAKCNVQLGRFEEARRQLEAAILGARKFDKWGPLSSAHFFLGCLQRELRDYASARESIQTARNIWLERSRMPTHHLNGAYLYKLGCVADDLGETETSIQTLRDALVIAKLRDDVMSGDYARILHKLSAVLKKLPGGEVEASEKEAEAKRLLHTRKNSGVDSALSEDWSVVSTTSSVAGEPMQEGTGIESERPYDSLVYFLWR